MAGAAANEAAANESAGRRGADLKWFKATLAYDGTAYAGWQVQANQATVQQVVETAIARITGQRIRVTASGRTDAGVHALGQVVGFAVETRLDAQTLMRAINSRLPMDVILNHIEAAPVAFDPIREAVRKRYRYMIHDGPQRDVFSRDHAWHHREPLDAELMHEAAQCLLGKHDFSSFETSGSERATSVRTITDIFASREQPPIQNMLRVEVEADGFLYNMVRAIVGTLVDVGRGVLLVEEMGPIVAACDRRKAGRTAPPQGLFLVNVDYSLATETVCDESQEESS